MTKSKFAYDHPDAAIDALAAKLSVVDRIDRCENGAAGRVLAAAIIADRDSPAADVSAMDGYAVREGDLQASGAIPIVGESSCGAAPPEMPQQAAVRIFTGAIVPGGCDLVIKREDTIEGDHQITLCETARSLASGANIRRQGENRKSGDTVVEAGTSITAATRAAMINFGFYGVDLFSPVRVAVITTGEELISPKQVPEAWQLRNSNRYGIASLLSLPWIDVTHLDHVGDEKALTVERLRQRATSCDAVILTGGVSMGDYDFVPDAVKEVGGEIAFHGLPIRPGKPILGASTSDGKLIVGLPGNPVSAMVNAKRIVLPLLAKISGRQDWKPRLPSIFVRDLRETDLPLHRSLLVKLADDGTGELVASKGSGDLVALGQSDGFIEVPIGSDPKTAKPFYRW